MGIENRCLQWLGPPVPKRSQQHAKNKNRTIGSERFEPSWERLLRLVTEHIVVACGQSAGDEAPSDRAEPPKKIP